MKILYKNRFFFTIDGDLQGEGQGSVVMQANIPEDAYYLPDPPGSVADQEWGIVDWRWSHEAQSWVKVPRALDDPRGADDGETPGQTPAQLRPVTRRQLRLTLVRNGIALSSIEGLIAGMPEGLEKEEAQIEWADAQTFDRFHPTLLLIAQALELTSGSVDLMWLQAMQA